MLDGPELVGVEVRGCYVIMRRPRRFRAGLMPVCGSPRPSTSHRLIASKPPTYAGVRPLSGSCSEVLPLPQGIT